MRAGMFVIRMSGAQLCSQESIMGNAFQTCLQKHCSQQRLLNKKPQVERMCPCCDSGQVNAEKLFVEFPADHCNQPPALYNNVLIDITSTLTLSTSLLWLSRSAPLL